MKLIENLLKESGLSDLDLVIKSVNTISEELRVLQRNLDKLSHTDLKNNKDFNLIKKITNKVENDFGNIVSSAFSLNYKSR